MKIKLIILALFLIQLNFIKGQCSASFTYSNTGNGNISFTSTSTGTTVNTYYYWIFGDGNYSYSQVPNVLHNYQNGIYSPTLAIMDSITQCTSTVAATFTVNNAPCNNGTVSFTYNQQQNGLVNFNNTSPGLQNFNFSWGFGDGGTSNQNSPSHTYTLSGTYNVTVTATDLLNICTYSTVQSISVTVQSCSLNASFTYSINGGTVNFFSTSTGTSITTNYYWDFGDGYYDAIPNTAHTYSAPGTYTVQLFITDSINFYCSSTSTQTIFVNAPCLASVNFTMWKDSTQMPAIVWDAIPNYPNNIVSALWSWGDGSTSNALFPSHTYSAAGMYNICVTISVSCGATATACSNTNIYRMMQDAQNMSAGATVNVINAIPTSIKTNEPQLTGVKIFPNPNSGDFEIRAEGLNEEASVQIFDLLGGKVFESKLESSGSNKISLTDISSGCYLVKIISGDKKANTRIIIAR